MPSHMMICCVVLLVIGTIVAVMCMRSNKEGFGQLNKTYRIPLSDCEADCQRVYNAQVNGSYDIYGMEGKRLYIYNAATNLEACKNKCVMRSYANY